MKTKVSLIKCTSYNQPELENAVRFAVERIGGIGRFVKPGERILLKPNLLSAKPPERAITTHPEVVRAIIHMVREAGATPLVGDSPGGAVRGVERVWNETGMKKVCDEEKVELVNFETSGADEIKINHRLQPSVHLAKILFQVDGIINLPKLKTHSFAVYTGAIKNFYGCIPGLRKAEYHKHILPYTDDFGDLLAEIYLQLKDRVRFTLIDGILGMEGNGPSSGDVRKLDMLLASDDVVALDTAVTHLLGFKPEKIKIISCLGRKKLGENDIANIEISGNNPSEFNLGNFKFPDTWYYTFIPKWLVGILGRLLWLKPEIVKEQCTACQFCVKSCPVGAIKMEKDGKPLVRRKECISCLCCHELCPRHAVELKTSLLARRFVRR